MLKEKLKRLKKDLAALGPGFVTGAADDDPSGIGTYSQTGAILGYTQLWLALFCTPFMIVIQEMCGRLGLIKGRGLALLIRQRYGQRILLLAVVSLLVANTINIGADLGAMASTMQMLVGGNFVFWLIGFTALILFLEVFISYKTYAKYLKYLALSLLTYILTAFVVTRDWGPVLAATFIPHWQLNKDFFMNTVAVLGTTFSPYLFFWQASEEVEEEVIHHQLIDMDVGRPHIHKDDLRRMRLDTAAGMILSNTVMFFIIVTAAETLGVHGLREITTADQAAEALRPLAGNLAYLLFALGIIGTGLLAVPVLAGSASYAVAEALGWRSGLYRKLRDAHGFYGIITIATLIGLLVNFTSFTSFQMLYLAAVASGVVAPILMAIIVMLTSDRRTMGKHVNSWPLKVMGWTITFLMFGCIIAFLAFSLI